MGFIKLFKCTLLFLLAISSEPRSCLVLADSLNATSMSQSTFKEGGDISKEEFAVDGNNGNPVINYSYDIIVNNASETAPNLTLDVNGSHIPAAFDISPFQPRWFEYYNRSSEFVKGSGELESCSRTHPSSKLPSFAEEVEGVWAACQNDDGNKTQYPNIKYNNRHPEFEGFRTLTLKYYLSGEATLRLTMQGVCYDYSIKHDSSSYCTFLGYGKEREGWSHSKFTIKNETLSFRVFNIELIAESTNDLVLIDKVEATVHFLPDDPEDENSESASTTKFSDSKMIFCALLVYYVVFKTHVGCC